MNNPGRSEPREVPLASRCLALGANAAYWTLAGIPQVLKG
jgi:hypothetical protein